MKILTLPIESRENIGSASARRYRKAGRLPVNLYGMDRPPSSLTVDMHTFGLAFERGSRMFELEVEGQTQVCLLKDVQYNSLGNKLLHADFWRIDDSKPVVINVGIELVGVPVPVSGAVVDYVTRDVQVECLPRQIPAHLELNIADLQVGEHMDAKDVPLPEGARLVGPPETTIVSFHYKHAGTVESEDEEEGSAEPEVLTERKPDEDSDG